MRAGLREVVSRRRDTFAMALFIEFLPSHRAWCNDMDVAVLETSGTARKS
jgi:hypothetical protein